MNTKNGASCLTPFCDDTFVGNRGSRGLCARCYYVAYMAVQFKLTTWEALAEQKKVDSGKPDQSDSYGERIKHFTNKEEDK